MSSPSEPHPPTEPAGEWSPSTAEIPVAAPAGATAVGNGLPPHPDAAPPAPVPIAVAQPTGPVDFVPGLPGLGTPPVPPPATSTPPPPIPTPPAAVPSSDPVRPPMGGTVNPDASAPSWPDTLESHVAAPGQPPTTARARGPLDRTALTGLGLAALAVVLVLLGVSLTFGGESLWSTVPLWSGFATLCAALGLLAFAAFYPAGNRLRSAPTWRVAAAGLVGLSVFWLLVILPRADSDRGFVLTAALACLGGALWIGPRARS